MIDRSVSDIFQTNRIFLDRALDFEAVEDDVTGPPVVHPFVFRMPANGQQQIPISRLGGFVYLFQSEPIGVSVPCSESVDVIIFLILVEILVKYPYIGKLTSSN